MKIALVLNDNFSAWHFRKGLIRALIARGIEVTVITPDGEYVARLIGLGAGHVTIPMERFISPLRDIKLCVDLYRVFRSKRPDLVHTMTAKPNIYGAIAARLAGVPKVVALVSGLGYGFSTDGGWKQWAVRRIVSGLYFVAGQIVDRVWFQNSEDMKYFEDRGLIRRGKAVLIRSGGINLSEYSPSSVNQGRVEELRSEMGIDGSVHVVVMMVARVVWSKGVKEFIEAADRVARAFPRVLFLLVGPLDPDSPDPVPDTYLRQNKSSRFLWMNFRTEVKEILSLADIVSLPSYYPEGIPRVLLEAMAMGKPIVTTNHVGCREVVEEGRNGFRVPIKNSAALAEAILRLLKDSTVRRQMGAHSRQKAKTEFDERKVIEQVMADLYGLAFTGEKAKTGAPPGRIRMMESRMEGSFEHRS